LFMAAMIEAFVVRLRYNLSNVLRQTEMHRNKIPPTFDPNLVRLRWRSVGVPVAH
jgi:hypothetical protein